MRMPPYPMLAVLLLTAATAFPAADDACIAQLVPGASYTSLHAVVVDAFRRNPKRSRLWLTHGPVHIMAQRDTMAPPEEVSEIWLWVQTGTSLTAAQIDGAVGLFASGATTTECGVTSFDAERQHVSRFDVGNAMPAYTYALSGLRGVFDMQPVTSGLSDRISSGPDYLPRAQWGSIYLAFDTPRPGPTGRGVTWNSVILFRDGMALRIATPADLLGALAPAIDWNAVTDADMNHPEVAETIAGSITENGRLGINAVLAKLSNAGRPVIGDAELERLATYAGSLVGLRLADLPYTVAETDRP